LWVMSRVNEIWDRPLFVRNASAENTIFVTNGGLSHLLSSGIAYRQSTLHTVTDTSTIESELNHVDRTGDARASRSGPASRAVVVGDRLQTYVATGGAVVLAALFAWAYWPTLVKIVEVWNKEPDYTHGFLVTPIALFFLWVRRDTYPKSSVAPAWTGLILIAASVGFRTIGGMFYFDSIDGWTIPIWIGGMVWLLGGKRLFLWSASSVAFLWFMIPLPWRVEQMLSWPLQRVATEVTCWLLQCLGQPALAAGNVILLGEHELEVAQACSGLRMFMGIAAVAFAYIILVGRPWWEKLLLCAAIAPVAVAANILRITATGLLYQYASGDLARAFSHDAAGWVMIPLAAALFGVVLWWIDRLFVEIEPASQRELVRRGSSKHGSQQAP